MKLLDLTLPSPAENLALDEALLDAVASEGERLRFWQADAPAVILGRASRVAEEVEQEFCQRERIPVLRRCSGGATVVIGPGCLMYAVTLSVARRPELAVIDQAHRFVLERMRLAFAQAGIDIGVAGTCDLVLRERKFSGNALRCRRDGVLYHGTLLLDADLELIGSCLKMPPRQPDYRARRSHLDFLTNLGVAASELRRSIASVWQASEVADAWPTDRTRELVANRYEQDSWHLSR